MDGVLNVRKESGPTSHDVVHQVRLLFGQKRVGHAGTLDPMATGVLVVCLGKGTRIVEYLMGTTKEYRARMILGLSTNSEDSTGEIVRESDSSGVTREAFENTAAEFVGDIMQVPPMVSAIKHEGQRLYKLARQGKVVERKAREVTIYGIDVLDFVQGAQAEAEIMVRCSSGTYIRTLCSDIGDKLGCGGHMSMLKRTSVGGFTIDESFTIEQLAQAKSEDKLVESVIPIDKALRDMPAVTISAEYVDKAVNGLPVPIVYNDGNGHILRILTPTGDLIGIGSVSSGEGHTTIKPHKVLAGQDD